MSNADGQRNSAWTMLDNTGFHLLQKGSVCYLFSADGVHLVVVTDGGAEIAAWTKQGDYVRFRPPAAVVVDTVGAGDSFQAALLSKLSTQGDPLSSIKNLDTESLSGLLSYCATAAATTCSRRGANLPFHSDLSQTGAN